MGVCQSAAPLPADHDHHQPAKQQDKQQAKQPASDDEQQAKEHQRSQAKQQAPSEQPAAAEAEAKQDETATTKMFEASSLDEAHPLFRKVRESIVGDDEALDGPFGTRRLVYSDYTASGRPVSFIEEFIQNEVMPMYANTHTETSGTGLQTTRFRDQARRLVLESVGGDPDLDVVVFAGSGATGAIKKIIDVLQIHIPLDLDKVHGFRKRVPPHERPVVFIGPYEHHSNELMWRDSICDVYEIDETCTGHLDLEMLERLLIKFADRPLKIGSFSAASNVTGIMTNVDKVSYLLHKHGALSFWDYAAAAPYVPITMNGPTEYCGSWRQPQAYRNEAERTEPYLDHEKWTADEMKLIYKDAVFISPHKFPGGPGTPGVLVAKKKVFTNTVPGTPGGGTVRFVSPCCETYLADIEHREEGGTPAIIESIRCGLVFQMKRAVNDYAIMRAEHHHLSRALKRWSENPNIFVIGNANVMRLSIVSMFIKYRGGPLFLHYNFVVALLNDLFGIQARGGCSCAGPYGLRLVRIDQRDIKKMAELVSDGYDIVKVGWVRVNFNYFISDTVADYVIDAIDFIATHGWKLMPYYEVDYRSGTFTHKLKRRGLFNHTIGNLGRIRYDAEQGLVYKRPQARQTLPESALPGFLEEAHRIVKEAVTQLQGWTIPQQDRFTVDPRVLHARSFVLPFEALEDMQIDLNIDHSRLHREQFKPVGNIVGTSNTPGAFVRQASSKHSGKSSHCGDDGVVSDDFKVDHGDDSDSERSHGSSSSDDDDDDDDNNKNNNQNGQVSLMQHLARQSSTVQLPLPSFGVREYPLDPREHFERRQDLLRCRPIASCTAKVRNSTQVTMPIDGHGASGKRKVLLDLDTLMQPASQFDKSTASSRGKRSARRVKKGVASKKPKSPRRRLSARGNLSSPRRRAQARRQASSGKLNGASATDHRDVKVKVRSRRNSRTD
eukprot:TRINITY_DN65849_c6_g1_i1.p1 TRINITY_DN65849_c6_g1~~TRINITY_DN65849_c6_g1_i1.p1  ORF type:complete len:949 (-),score=442.28 TRINITY_DN65849_c6_g1_i1:103-2949(-)